MLNDKNLPKAWAKLNDLDNKKFDKTGGTLTGVLNPNAGITITNDAEISFLKNTDHLKIGFKNVSDADTDSYGYIKMGDNSNEYFKFISVGGASETETLSIKMDNIRFRGHQVYHQGFKPTPAEIGAINKTGDTISGDYLLTNHLWGLRIKQPSSSEESWARGMFYNDNLNTDNTIGGIGKSTLSGVESFYMSFGTSPWDGSNGIKYIKNNNLFVNNHQVYHQGFKPTPEELSAIRNTQNNGYLASFEAGNMAFGIGKSNEATLVSKTGGKIFLNYSIPTGYIAPNEISFCKGQQEQTRANLLAGGFNSKATGSSYWYATIDKNQGLCLEDVALPNSSSYFIKMASSSSLLNSYGFYNRTALGVLRSQNDAGGSFLISTMGDTESHPHKIWAFKYSDGSFSCPGDITGARVFNAVWNDYAEYFPKVLNYKTEPGDIIALSLDNDEEHYELATEEHNLIVGVHSDQYGHLIGGEHVPADVNEEFETYNNKRYIPVGLVGRLPVKFIGEAKKGIKVVPSNIPGVGRAFNSKLDDYDKVIGYIVENNNEPGIRKVKIKIGK